MGSERLTINGRVRYPDFPTRETIPQENIVIEVKNKTELTTDDRKTIENRLQSGADWT